MITQKDIERALEILKEYKNDKTVLDSRIIQNEQWWDMRSKQGGHSPWIFNTIANKHADAMDNYPEAAALPREEGDRKCAEALSAVLPAVFEDCNFEKTYSDAWYDKLKFGAACYGVFWNPNRGYIGDIEINRCHLFNLFWQNGVKNIQSSPHLFCVKIVNNSALEAEYPKLCGKLSNPDFEPAKYLYEGIDTTEGKTAVVDWYYKKREKGRQVLHYCKFAHGEILFSSENEKMKNGFYAHGKYPFVIDCLYPVESSPCGFGVIDVLKDTQEQIDSLNAAIVENAKMSSKVRYFIRDDGSVNEAEFADWRRPLVHVQGSKLGEDSLRQIKVSPLATHYSGILQNKIEELKEIGGNRDFTQGGTTGGITAASAIVALQEAGSKLSRDMIKGSYNAYTQVVELVVELMREFYKAPRFFRVTGKGGESTFLAFSGDVLRGVDQGEVFGVELGSRVHHFEIKIKAQRQSPFAKVSQNEMAKEFFALGFFAPGREAEALACLSMMDFEGKEALCEKIRSLTNANNSSDNVENGGVAGGANNVLGNGKTFLLPRTQASSAVTDSD